MTLCLRGRRYNVGHGAHDEMFATSGVVFVPPEPLIENRRTGRVELICRACGWTFDLELHGTF